MPLEPLAVPAVVVASSDDPHCTMERARQFAEAWGATLTPPGCRPHQHGLQATDPGGRADAVRAIPVEAR